MEGGDSLSDERFARFKMVVGGRGGGEAWVQQQGVVRLWQMGIVVGEVRVSH